MRDQKTEYSLETDDSSNLWTLSGDIGFHNVASLEKESAVKRQHLSPRAPWLINLKKVRHADSAALAWLIENLRYAHQHEIDMTVMHIRDDHLQKLLHAQGLGELLKYSDAH